MHVPTDEDVSMMDEQANIATQSQSNDNQNAESSVEILYPVPLEDDQQSLAVAGTKRHQDFPVQDGLQPLPKYRKLENVQHNFEPKEGRRASSSSDEFCNESPNAEDRNNKENFHLKENLCSYSSEGSIQLQSADNATGELDSEAESEAISPQREILNNTLISRIENKGSHETINNKLTTVSTAMRLQTNTVLASELSSDKDLENNNTNAVACMEFTIKQSNSQIYNTTDDSSDEPVNIISIPENSSMSHYPEDYVHQGESDEVEEHNNNGITAQETVVSNYLYAVASQSIRQADLKIENTSSQDQNSQSSHDMYPEQIGDGQSGRNQSQIQDNEVPSTSRDFEENSYALNRSGSVSELNLAHLVLSLKSDIQKLTEKVERQEVMLDAVVHAHEVHISPLFIQSFKEKYSLKIPFTRLEDFLKFNDDLSKDKKFCHEFTTSLIGFIDKQVTFAKNILNMVKQYMSKDLALLFNASKPTPNKMVLKDTLFCRCLLQATKMTLQDDTLPLEHEKKFMKNLGHVISGARGWHNHNDESSS